MFSNSTKYAIRSVVYLGHQEKELRFTVQELSKELDVPKPYLSKILQRLAKNEIISSFKGKGGGFYMNSDNRGKKLIDVIIAIEGHDVFSKCILGLDKCNNTQPCFLHKEFLLFKEKLNSTIRDETIAELSQQNHEIKF